MESYNSLDTLLKIPLVVSRLNYFLAKLYPEKDDKFTLQYSWFEWCIKSLMLESKFHKEIALNKKHIVKHFDYDCLKGIENVQQINEYFSEIYDVYHPIRNNVETLDSIEEIRQYLQ